MPWGILGGHLVATFLEAFHANEFVGPPDPTWCPELWAASERVGLPYVSGWPGKYTHITYPMARLVLEDGRVLEGLELERSEYGSLGDVYAKHLAASLIETKEAELTPQGLRALRSRR